MIRIEGQAVLVETRTLTARIEKGFLTSLRSKDGGAEWIRPFRTDAAPALQLMYADGQPGGFDTAKPLTITPLPISDHCAEVRFHGWDADGVLTIREDLESGDLVVEPSAYSSRMGVLSCRWNVPGLPEDIELVAPFFQGVKLKLDDELIRDSHWRWPMFWEAGLAILQGKAGGFWVHAQDTSFRYKGLKVGTSSFGPNSLALDTDAYGPIDSSLGAGGLAWRINVHSGDWKAAASQYRDWLWRAYGLKQREQQRRNWVHDIRLAMSWCWGDPEVLNAIASKVSPNKVLIHLSEWRTDAYDENYPTYTPTDKAKAFVAKGKAMGFHILPHCNSVDMDPSNPAYAYLRDFQYRDVQSKGLLGWGWEAGKVLSVPNSNAALLQNRSRKVMVKIHPGLSMWRSILAENIRKAVTDVGSDSVFIDVTLTNHNLHNCLVENMTSTEGMRKLIDHVAELNDGLVVGGEGLNEITMQGLSFAQAHLFQSWHATRKGLERAGGCALNAFLFGELARTFGYSGLSGKNEEEQLRSRVHLSLGAIPTFTGLGPEQIRRPGPAIKELFELANSTR